MTVASYAAPRDLYIMWCSASVEYHRRRSGDCGSSAVRALIRCGARPSPSKFGRWYDCILCDGIESLLFGIETDVCLVVALDMLSEVCISFTTYAIILTDLLTL